MPRAALASLENLALYQITNIVPNWWNTKLEHTQNWLHQLKPIIFKHAHVINIVAKKETSGLLHTKL